MRKHKPAARSEFGSKYRLDLQLCARSDYQRNPQLIDTNNFGRGKDYF